MIKSLYGYLPVPRCKQHVLENETEVSINRYTGSGDLISESEGEVQTNVPTDWGGPKELLDLCKEQPGTVRILKKTAKDQSYLRVTGF